jgi:hypothetical protein
MFEVLPEEYGSDGSPVRYGVPVPPESPGFKVVCRMAQCQPRAVVTEHGREQRTVRTTPHSIFAVSRAERINGDPVTYRGECPRCGRSYLLDVIEFPIDYRMDCSD